MVDRRITMLGQTVPNLTFATPPIGPNHPLPADSFSEGTVNRAPYFQRILV
jgi:hypothetical protein